MLRRCVFVCLFDGGKAWSLDVNGTDCKCVLICLLFSPVDFGCLDPACDLFFCRLPDFYAMLSVFLFILLCSHHPNHNNNIRSTCDLLRINYGPATIQTNQAMQMADWPPLDTMQMPDDFECVFDGPGFPVND